MEKWEVQINRNKRCSAPLRFGSQHQLALFVLHMHTDSMTERGPVLLDIVQNTYSGE